jgi:hypothetical protein
MDHAFGLNFVLYNEQLDKAGRADFVAGKVANDCWEGTQTRVAATR